MSTRLLRRRQPASYPVISRVRRGFTLVEMLIAMVLTLIMVYAIAEFYAYVGEAVKDGRAVIEMRGGLRTATQRLKADLDLRTVKMDQPVEDAAAQGYFAAQEGVCNDAAPSPLSAGAIDADGTGGPDIGQDTNGDGIVDYLDATINATNLYGDIDDWMGFTIRSDADPFTAPAALLDLSTGVFTGTGMQTSTVAEVVWFTSFTDAPTYATPNTWDAGETRTLHRRLLLVRPDVNQTHSGDGDYNGPYYVRVPGTDVGQAYYELMQVSDVSVRPFTVSGVNYVYFMANSLADLTRRENRFMNVMGAAAFPNTLDLNPHFAGDPTQDPWDAANNNALYRWVLNGTRRGEDIVLSNVLAFDMRVYDPTAVLLTDTDAAVTLQPGDPGYNYAAANGFTQIGMGAYVDLNYSRYVPGLGVTYPGVASDHSYYGAPHASSYFPNTSGVFDSWATSYERDGLNQDWAADAAGGYMPAPTSISDAPFDEGTDGLDSDSQNGVDDANERETRPPYPRPLRGIEVRVRIYEPGTRQAQQATVSADFVPE